MKITARRAACAGLAAAVASLGVLAPAEAKEKPRPAKANHFLSAQLLSFNDFHGHLEAEDDDTLDEELDPGQTVVGGAEHLATVLDQLRAGAENRSLTVAAGDLIGGSPFLSALFHDEPSVASLEELGLDLTSVGNHEFDEGTDELLRMQYGGCHPEDGCYFEDEPYDGADFPWLAANVVEKSSGDTLLPGTAIRKVKGARIGFIGMTLEDTPTLVSPAGVADVEFRDEVETADAQAAALRERGVEAIVVLLHEGGYQEGTYDECVGPSGPVVEIAEQMTADVDMLITGHTHQPYVCSIPDPEGQPRLVTSAASYGRVVTETDLVIDRRTKDVDRDRTTATNHLVPQSAPADPAQTAIIEKWDALASVVGGQVVGSVAEDITGDADTTNRDVETPMADVVADAFLAATDGPDEGGAQIAVQNVGGTRDSLYFDEISAGEQPGEITYKEAFDVVPFGNRLVTITLTGDQLERALEQQYVPTRGRPTLALGVSEGFTYEWDASQPQGERVVPGSMMLDGAPVDPSGEYRVALANFLQEGGDQFTVFTEGTDLLGGPEDVPAFTAYLGANPGLTAPADRVDGL
jgi:5'-nucleotidase